eukprot:7039155-Heterocapsa_arctica.AAC.1
MAEMMVAGDSDIGTDMWFQNAVELNRFYIGDKTESLTVCAQKTADRITAFTSSANEGQTWMANHISAPFKRAIDAYTAYLVSNGLTNSRVNDQRGASDSSAPTYAVVKDDSGPASVALREKLEAERLEAERRIELTTATTAQKEQRYSPSDSPKAVYVMIEAEDYSTAASRR